MQRLRRQPRTGGTSCRQEPGSWPAPRPSVCSSLRHSHARRRAMPVLALPRRRPNPRARSGRRSAAVFRRIPAPPRVAYRCRMIASPAPIPTRPFDSSSDVIPWGCKSVCNRSRRGGMTHGAWNPRDPGAALTEAVASRSQGRIIAVVIVPHRSRAGGTACPQPPMLQPQLPSWFSWRRCLVPLRRRSIPIRTANNNGLETRR